MRLAILTSNHLRHHYFADTLAAVFDVATLLQEEKKRDPSKKGEGTALDKTVQSYFVDRENTEQAFFGDHRILQNIATDRIVEIVAGEINTKMVLTALHEANPDYLVVFGSSILGTEIIEAFPGRIINMHLGLSPYYRGSGTNFWPLYDEKPEYVGVTIHYLDAGIDTGAIIVQGRPEIEKTDTPHTIGNKTIAVGIALMIDVLKEFEKGHTLHGVQQNHSEGKLCLFKDCEAHHIAALMEKWPELIEGYVDVPVDIVSKDSW